MVIETISDTVGQRSVILRRYDWQAKLQAL